VVANALHTQEYAGFCDAPSCWSTDCVRLIKQPDKPTVRLCRFHRKQYFGISS